MFSLVILGKEGQLTTSSAVGSCPRHYKGRRMPHWGAHRGLLPLPQVEYFLHTLAGRWVLYSPHQCWTQPCVWSAGGLQAGVIGPLDCPHDPLSLWQGCMRRMCPGSHDPWILDPEMKTLKQIGTHLSPAWFQPAAAACRPVRTDRSGCSCKPLERCGVCYLILLQHEPTDPATLEILWQFLLKLKSHCLYNLAIPL